MRTTNYNSKIFNSKRLHIIVTTDKYEILLQNAKQLGLNMTTFIEFLIDSYEKKNLKAKILTKIQKEAQKLDKLNALINFNKKFYLDLNATFSNLNQIALRLNIANLDSQEELQNLINQDDFKANTLQTLQEAKEAVLASRTLVLELIKELQNKQKTIKVPKLKEDVIKQSQELLEKIGEANV